MVFDHEQDMITMYQQHKLNYWPFVL